MSDQPKEAAPFRGWFILPVLFLAFFAGLGLPNYAGSVIIASMAADLGIDRATYGLGFTVWALSAGLSGSLVAWIVQRIGVRLSMTVGSVVCIAAALALTTFVTTGVGYVLVFGVVLGLGGALISTVPVQTCVCAWFVRRRARALSFVWLAPATAGFVAAPLISMLVASYGWRAGWISLAAVCLVVALLALAFVRNKPSDVGQFPDNDIAAPEGDDQETDQSPKDDPWPLKAALRKSAMWLIILGAATYNGVGYFFISHSIPHFTVVLGSREEAAVAISMFAMGSILGKLVVGAIGDRTDPRYAWSGALALIALAILGSGFVSGSLLVYGCSGTVGLGIGASTVCWPTLTSKYFGTESFASVLGAQVSVMSVAAAATPYLGGVLFEITGGYDAAFIGAAVLATISALSILRLRVPLHGASPPSDFSSATAPDAGAGGKQSDGHAPQ